MNRLAADVRADEAGVTDTYNIVRIEAFTHKKHIVHPGYPTQDAAKAVLKDMAQAVLKRGEVVQEFELAFTTPANQDFYRVEEAKYFRG